MPLSSDAGSSVGATSVVLCVPARYGRVGVRVGVGVGVRVAVGTRVLVGRGVADGVTGVGGALVADGVSAGTVGPILGDEPAG